METIWLNLGMAAIWLVIGEQHWMWLAPLSLAVLLYSFAHDWHEDACHYREALAELDASSKLS